MRIGELARRVGVPPETLRMWERRYGVLNPRRSAGNTRLYSSIDEARLRLMQRYLEQGMSASEAAEQAVSARLTVRPGNRSSVPPEEAAEASTALQEALARFDETDASRALEPLLTAHAPVAVLRDVLLPYLHDVGERWATAHTNVAQEHFTTNFVMARMFAMARGWDRGLGPRALLACAPGEQHTLGLLAFGIALHQLGWRITFLGADVPVPMVEVAATTVRPELVVLSLSMAGRLAPADGLDPLAAAWPCALGGAGVSAALCASVGAQHLLGDPITAAYDVCFTPAR